MNELPSTIRREMKSLRLYPLFLIVVSALTGCAKNEDVEKLQSQVRELQDRQVEVASDLQNKLNAANATVFDLQREVERMKASESALAAAAKIEREAERDAASKSLHAEFADLKQAIAAIAKSPVESVAPLPTDSDSAGRIANAIEAETAAADQRARDAQTAAEMRAIRAQGDADQRAIDAQLLNSAPSR